MTHSSEGWEVQDRVAIPGQGLGPHDNMVESGRQVGVCRGDKTQEELTSKQNISTITDLARKERY